MARVQFNKAEIRTLRLVNLGLSNQEIAAKLSTTVGTTKWRLHEIFTKLQVKSRTAAAASARKRGLI